MELVRFPRTQNKRLLGGNRGTDTRSDGYPDVQEKDISKVRSFKSDRQIQLFLLVGGGRRSGLERLS